MIKKCILPISIGNKYFEGNKFAKYIKNINKNFTHCDIIVADTLQRHNFALKNIVEPKKYSFDLGTKWIESNITTISKLNIKYNISRWDKFLISPEYDKIHEYTHKLYSQDLEFNNLVKHDVNKYCNNYKKYNNEKIDDYILEEVSTTYILEECSVIQLWNNYDCIVYPDKLPKSILHIENCHL